jgi:hypothetical protein
MLGGKGSGRTEAAAETASAACAGEKSGTGAAVAAAARRLFALPLLPDPAGFAPELPDGAFLRAGGAPVRAATAIGWSLSTAGAIWKRGGSHERGASERKRGRSVRKYANPGLGPDMRFTIPRRGKRYSCPSAVTPRSSTSLTSSVDTPVTQFSAAAAGTNPDGTPPPEGTPAGTNPDGTPPVTNPEGTPDATTNPDGTAKGTNPDGTPDATNPDGAPGGTNPDGTSEDTNTDVTAKGRNPDGAPGGTNPDGTAKGTNADGTAKGSNPDGAPDGSPAADIR